MSQPQTYLARVEFGPGNYSQETPFLAADDQAAIAAGRDARRAVANSYCRGFNDQVRVRVYSLELGTWNEAEGYFTTTSSRQLLDTLEEDAEARRNPGTN